MSGLEALESLIYHEKQQEGSMLCAQHALNSLLQGHYFTAPDLSDIARGLDDLEESYDDSNSGGTSTNMDDTGFFSIQVLENALKVWGLNLIRWRGEEMRPFQDHPQTQLAFILNLEQHWFTLRRFGSADSGVDSNEGGHWFNLNSSLPNPEWVSKLYLGMVLQQAEADGYSVFVVTPGDPSAPTTLPRTDADEIAATLDEPRLSGRPNFQTSRTIKTSPGNNDGFEEEDYELQAALQASLMNTDATEVVSQNLGGHLPRPPHAQAPLLGFQPEPPSGPVSGTLTPLQFDPIGPPAVSNTPLQLPGHADLDPVAASIERNRVMLQRMREQQEFAQRELWAETGGVEPLHISAANEARRREREEEEENLRRAIEESEALAKAEGHERLGGDPGHEPAAQNPYPIINPSDAHRVYDDDDAELQAALKASLEQAPAGWEPSQWNPKQLANVPGSSAIMESVSSHPTARDKDLDDDESVISEGTNTTGDLTSDAGPSQESVSVDELRKRRLARFGA
ncbi:Josephin-domain-containing protein [Infundibulicybe gibba]|nr:Josephin-domain-containing protein [Infundibulicybe gibba]